MQEQIIGQLKADLKTATAELLPLLWQKYFGKTGLVTVALKELNALSIEEKRAKGPALQAMNAEAREIFLGYQESLAASEREKSLLNEKEELGTELVKLGHLHPLSVTIKQLNDLFQSLGFSIAEEREIETDEFCFQRLNVPADHPARDMQDTIYIEEPNILLRTQTSSIEARVLAGYKPPFKVVSPGKAYRNEKVNKSNHFIFHQYQGFVVLPETNLKDLFGIFTYLFRHMYGDEVVIRYRNKYYPEVEPGVGPDMQCFNCHGKGCAVCKNVGWIEMGGAGMIHPRVLAMAGLDPKQCMGFAFGLGLDRWVMAKYKITDIRTLLGGNLAYKADQHESII